MRGVNADIYTTNANYKKKSATTTQKKKKTTSQNNKSLGVFNILFMYVCTVQSMQFTVRIMLNNNNVGYIEYFNMLRPAKE